MKYITMETAPEMLGKTVDCYKRLFHYYPMKIVQIKDGRYCVVDRHNVCMPINDGERIPFDFVIKEDKQ